MFGARRPGIAHSAPDPHWPCRLSSGHQEPCWREPLRSANTLCQLGLHVLAWRAAVQPWRTACRSSTCFDIRLPEPLLQSFVPVKSISTPAASLLRTVHCFRECPVAARTQASSRLRDPPIAAASRRASPGCVRAHRNVPRSRQHGNATSAAMDPSITAPHCCEGHSDKSLRSCSRTDAILVSNVPSTRPQDRCLRGSSMATFASNIDVAG